MGKVTAQKAKRPHAKGVLCDASFPIAHRGRGKSLSVWVRLGRANSPHAKEVLCDTLFPVSHRGRGKSLSVWMRLGSANRSQVGHDVLFPTAHGGER